MKNLYEVLGIAPDASSDDIRAAYRNKVKDVHPDAGGSNEAFSEVAIAYEVLIDPLRRKNYDESGSILNQDKAIAAGARIIVEGLVDQLLGQDDAKYLDIVDVLCREIARALAAKMVTIGRMDQRRRNLVDLRGRFRAKAPDESFLDQLMAKKIEALDNSIASERLSIAQLNAASALLQRYEFIREHRETPGAGRRQGTPGPEPAEPLIDFSGLWSEGKRGER
ncbi:MAG: J domain-containing protein [Rhodopseudomonas sp.]|uniref:J domain-containing protein n=1 Tax=Rhodopseudomonas sp. TaxID=1078 RepID=UPI0017EE39F5|nr:J domain-containing protein [Rhodopseudomonas sp.]NVN88819.1 J domain-containing protein [Rhodopseudomonas sp.]